MRQDSSRYRGGFGGRSHTGQGVSRSRRDREIGRRLVCCTGEISKLRPLNFSAYPLRCHSRADGNPVFSTTSIGVGTTHWIASPLPPNRTGGFPASGSPVGGFTSLRTGVISYGRPQD